MKKGITGRGVPQRLLSDNGLALNPSRRGWEGQLVTYVTSLGVEAITGKPNKPTTQGKNERFHQTLLRWLDKQPLASTIEELQAQVDAFDIIYNTERPHQGLPGRITPQTAWDATPVAEPPRPRPDTPVIPTRATSPVRSQHTIGGVRTTKVRGDGTIRVRKIEFRLGSRYAGQLAHVIAKTDHVAFYDHEGTLIAEADWPAPGTTYVGTKQLRWQ